MNMQEPARTGHTIGRRDALRYAALVGTGVAVSSSVGFGSRAEAHDREHERRGILPAPQPIPGGLAPDFHVFAPGPTDITLPFSGAQLQGLDVEPSVLTDYAGFTVLAYHVGTAVGSDGTRYNLETDMRAYRGRYVASDGTTRTGSFGFVWVDLYEPGSGSQVHDYNGGVQPSGLFWLVPIPRHAFKVSDDGRRATLAASHVPVVDSFQFGGPVMVPAEVSVRITWEATGAPRPRGKGSTVPPTDPGAFLGTFARARSTASFQGSALGFGFRSETATTDRGYALMGDERNGSALGGA